MTKVILIHGNGNGTGEDNWQPTVKAQLEAAGIPCLSPDFPDTPLARRQFWIPFLKNELQADKDTVIVGHSSGAVCAMRYAEEYSLLGSVLVGACYTDLGLESEKSSGYYDDPWQWDKIRAHQKWIALFASSDDPWIPIEEPRIIHKNLKTDYFEYQDRGHFGGDRLVTEFPECVAYLKEKLL